MDEKTATQKAQVETEERNTAGVAGVAETQLPAGVDGWLVPLLLLEAEDRALYTDDAGD